MKKLKVISAFVFTILIISYHASVKTAFCIDEEKSLPDQLLVFLENIIKLDLSKYTVNKLEPRFRYNDDLAGLSQLTGLIQLRSLRELNELDVGYSFVNGTLNYVIMHVQAGSPLYTQKISDMNTKVKGFMEDYQACTGDEEVAIMRSIVDDTDITKNSSSTSNNIKLEVEIMPTYMSFNWKYTFNGAKFSGINLCFDDNGTFRSFRDDRSYFKIGGTDVNISAEQAKSIALKRAENLSYNIRGRVIEDFVILEDRVRCELFTMGRDNPLMAYPYWTVILPLDKPYPGFVDWFEITLWADTGEIIDCSPMGGGGSLPANTPTPPANSFVSLSGDALVFVGAGAIVTIAVLAGITAVMAKKRKHKT